MYRIEHLFDAKDGRGLLVDDVQHYVEGMVEGRIVVSLPETISVSQAEAVQLAAQKEFEKPVVLITHNVEFMRVVKLLPKEAARIVGKAEENAEKITEAQKAALSRGRPGVREGGDSGVGVGGDAEAGATDKDEAGPSGPGVDETSDEEGSAVDSDSLGRSEETSDILADPD